MGETFEFLGKMGRGRRVLVISVDIGSVSKTQGIPMTLHRWQPSESPAKRSHRLFCLRQALQALEVLGRFGRDDINVDGEVARLLVVVSPTSIWGAIG